MKENDKALVWRKDSFLEDTKRLDLHLNFEDCRSQGSKKPEDTSTDEKCEKR